MKKILDENLTDAKLTQDKYLIDESKSNSLDYTKPRDELKNYI